MPRKTYKVYALFNHTRKEIYIGVSDLPSSRLGPHCDGETKTIEHWDCETDDIDWVDELEVFTTQSAASRRAHEIEREEEFPSLEDYTIFLTAGI